MYEQKSNIRSFRYSDKVAKVLEDFEGNSLNEKFNNLVLYCFDKLESRKQDLSAIELQIIKKRNESYELSKKLEDVSQLIKTLEIIKHYGEIAARGAKAIAEGEQIGSAKIKLEKLSNTNMFGAQ